MFLSGKEALEVEKIDDKVVGEKCSEVFQKFLSKMPLHFFTVCVDDRHGKTLMQWSRLDLWLFGSHKCTFQCIRCLKEELYDNFLCC